MANIYVLQNFDFAVEPYVTHAYTGGYTVEVSDDCAAFAVSRGYAVFADFAEDDLIEGRPEDREDDTGIDEGE